MLRIRGQEGYERYDLLIDKQTVIGCDNLIRGKFSKQWKIQQKAYTTRRKLSNPFLYKKTQKRKVRELAKNKNKNKKTKNITEDFHAFIHAIIPIVQEIWTDRCIDRNTPVVGGRIVAEYDSLTKKVTQMYTMKEMVLPEDETKNIQRNTSNKTRSHEPTIKEMDNTMETGNQS
jgi:transposase